MVVEVTDEVQEMVSKGGAVTVRKKTGAPTLYKEEYCERVIQLGAEGHSLTAIAAVLGYDPGTLYDWANRHEPFRHALARAKALEQLWWETEGMSALRADKFQAQVWAKSMTARFSDYADRQEITGRGGQALQVVLSPGDEDA